MIVDSDGALLGEDVGASPAARFICETLRRSDIRFVQAPDRAGLDCLCERSPDGGTSRARVKVFEPRVGTTVAFIYKDSLVPFSTDRFAYGALVVKNREPTLEETTSLLEYLASGLHPELRPPSLRRAFPFDVPR